MLSTRTRFHTVKTCCLLALAAWATQVRADLPLSGPQWDISGFYSLSALHTSQSGPLYLYAPYGDQDQPADQQHWDLWPDSKLGLMGEVRISPQWSARAQFLYRQGSSRENDFKTRLAFVEYQPLHDWSVRLGRTVQGLLLNEESMYTDYAHLPIRAPQEPYAYLPDTEIDGIQLFHRRPLHNWQLQLQASYGQRTYYSQQFQRQLRDSFGMSATLQDANTSLHLAARSLMLGLHDAGSFALATRLIRTVANSQGRNDVAADYDESAIRLKEVAAALEHQSGPLTLQGELVLFYSSLSMSGQPIAAAHLLGGYRLGAFTPYLGWGEIRDYSVSEETRLTPDSPTAVAAIATANYLTAAVSGEQRTWSLGLRYDIARNTALKLQLDRVERKAGKQGWFIAPPDSLQFAPDHANHTYVWGLSLQGMF